MIHGSWWGLGHCGCRWIGGYRLAQAGLEKETERKVQLRTGDVEGESGGRLEVRLGEKRQTLEFFR